MFLHFSYFTHSLILYSFISRWAPVEEHSRFITFTYIGANAGMIIAFPIYGLILDRLGWEVPIT